MANANLLIIDDERLIRWSLRERLVRAGHRVAEAENAKSGLEAIEKGEFDLVLLDYKLPDRTGLEVLREMRKLRPDVVVIMMTAFGTVENAVEAMRLGAFHYLAKPFNMEELAVQVERALDTNKLKREVRHLQHRLRQEYGVDRIIGDSQPIRLLFETIKGVARSGASTVFLRGESGTGKDLVAKTIHYNSPRADRPFMNITCTALAETLLESELFGHEKGAFTDARTTKKGLIELADGGTVFLDEVGDMPPGLQAKLLRFLEEKAFRRVGGTRDIVVDVRVIAASNRDIEKAIEDNQFRQDLFFRLNVVEIVLPPLRERHGDVPRLANYFAAAFSKEFRKPLEGISDEAMALLERRSWPGNVRELRNAIERAVLLTNNRVLQPDDFPSLLHAHGSAATDGIRLPSGGLDLQAVERELVKQALQMAESNQTRAAKLLHLSRDQLRYRMEKFGLL